MKPEFLLKLEKVLESNYSDPSFGAAQLSQILGMSRSNLLKKVKAASGKSIIQLINEYRLDKALELLRGDDLAISEIALKTGFTSASYFATSFKKHFGYSPGEAHAREENNISEQQPPHSTGGGILLNKKNKPKRRSLLTSVFIFLIIALSVVIFMVSTGRILKHNSIAVLPLRSNSQTQEENMMADILRQQIITTLSKVEVFNVRSASSSSNIFRDSEDYSMKQISRKLKSRYIIEGSIGSDEDSIRMHIQLIKGGKDVHDWATDYFFSTSGNERNNEMLRMAEHVAFQLNTEIKPKEKSAIRIACSNNTKSMQNYRIGNSLLSSEKGRNPWEALKYFEEAIKLDSTWVTPHVGKARALAAIIRSDPKDEYITERFKSIKKAIEISPLPFTYTVLTNYYLDQGELNKAGKTLRKGIRKDPEYNFHKVTSARLNQKKGRWNKVRSNYAMINELYPGYSSYFHSLGRTHQFMRNFPEAISYLYKGIAVNPKYSLHYFNLAEIAMIWEGDPKKAIKIVSDADKENPWQGFDPIRCHWIKTLAYIMDRKYEKALEELSLWFMVPAKHYPPYYYHPKYLYQAMVYGYLGQTTLEHSYYDSTRILIESELDKYPILQKKHTVQSCLGMAYAGLGDTTKALEQIKLVQSLAREHKDRFLESYAMEDVAWIYAKTGDTDRSLKTIKSLLGKPGPLTTMMLEKDPKWDTLKDLPEFKKLITRYAVDLEDIPPVVMNPMLTINLLPEIKGPSFTDERDGNVYHYNKIGSQTWMIQNLAWIPAVSTIDSSSFTEKHFYIFGNESTSLNEAIKSENYTKYGVLYNWEAAKDACPPGWRLPTDEEWKILEKHLGMSEDQADQTLERLSGSVGLKLKSEAGWPSLGNGDNSSGFFALPGGHTYLDTYMDVGKNNGWWSSTEFGSSQVMIRAVQFDTKGVFRIPFDKKNAISIRCIKN